MTRYLILSVLLFLTACQTFEEKSAANRLDDTLRRYEATLRWGRLEAAYNFLSQELRDETTLPANLENIKVTKYEPASPLVPVDPLTAKQAVTIYYVFQDEQVEHRMTDEQLWQREEDGKQWYRINPIPEF